MKARVPKGFGGAGAGNMQQIARQAQKLQEKMATAKDELDVKEYNASAGGDSVKVTVNGKLEVVNIEIKPEVIDPDDSDILIDMLKLAVNEAITAANEERESVMDSISGGLSIPGLF